MKTKQQNIDETLSWLISSKELTPEERSKGILNLAKKLQANGVIKGSRVLNRLKAKRR